MTVFIMIRHGESTGNIKRVLSNDKDRFPLTKKGRHQASIVGKELKGINIKKIYTSPILRTKQTAQIIADHLDCTIEEDERLKERYFGEFNNKKVSAIDWKTLLIKGGYKNIESWEEMYKRVVDFVKDRDEEYVIMVTHYDPIRVIVTKEFGLENELCSHGIVIPNASISIIEKNGEVYRKVIAVGIPPEKGMLKELLKILERFKNC
jgi:broad specificity phosphatase PhoE